MIVILFFCQGVEWMNDDHFGFVFKHLLRNSIQDMSAFCFVFCVKKDFGSTKKFSSDELIGILSHRK